MQDTKKHFHVWVGERKHPEAYAIHMTAYRKAKATAGRVQICRQDCGSVYAMTKAPSLT